MSQLIGKFAGHSQDYVIRLGALGQSQMNVESSGSALLNAKGHFACGRGEFELAFISFHLPYRWRIGPIRCVPRINSHPR